MTTPTGLLEWGQSGNYDAIADRTVIAALSAGRSVGLVQAPTLTAQSGLTISVGPWRAVVGCGDGTRAVIGSRTAQTINETAGGRSARTDVLWADINVDGATWTATFVASPVSPTRTGVALGTITVPAGAATAAAMTLAPGAVAASGSYSTFDAIQKSVTQTAFNDLTGTMTIPAGEPCAGDCYEIEAWGHGGWATGTGQRLTVRPALDGTTIAGGGIAYAAAYFSPGNTFRWHWTARLFIVSVGPSGSLTPMMFGELGGQADYTMNAGTSGITSGATQNDAQTFTTLDTTVAHTFKIQANWASTSGT